MLELRQCAGKIARISIGGAPDDVTEVLLQLRDLEAVDGGPPILATSFLSTPVTYQRDGIEYEANPNHQTLIALAMFASSNGFRVLINAYHADRPMASIHAIVVEVA